ncbi:hypothetical protein HanIR_Chr05g0253351 [Helianthus annuus]|nr:hypothetical protein HanIR_Chr05g0253351 [Helianthus annuus]
MIKFRLNPLVNDRISDSFNLFGILFVIVMFELGFVRVRMYKTTPLRVETTRIRFTTNNPIANLSPLL